MPSESGDIVLTAFGLHSSLGGIASAAAAFRCGLDRARELPDWNYFEEETLFELLLTGHPAAALNDGFQGMGRFLKMAEYAFGDLGTTSAKIALDPERLAALFVLPSNNGEEPLVIDIEKEFAGFAGKVWQRCGLRQGPKHVRAFFEGKIGAVAALREARSLLAGTDLNYCLIVAMDTLLDPLRIRALIDKKQVKTVDQPKGFMPGEAACFALVTRSGASQATTGGALISEPVRIPPERQSQPTAAGRNPEKAADEDKKPPPNGEVLSAVMMQALGKAKVEKTEQGTIYTDLNGEDSRAADLGSALVRLRPHHEAANWQIIIPALSFGETGAAGMLLAMGLAWRAMARGYAHGDNCLLVASPDTEESGAIVLRSLTHG